MAPRTKNELIRDLDEKNREIFDLRDQNKNISEQLKACLEKLDSLIAENTVMKTRLSALETGPVLPPATPLLVATPPPPTFRQHYNVLILSDSIYRHVGCEMPKIFNPATRTRALTKDVHVLHSHAPHISTPDILVKKIVVPGARAARLWSEASLISRTHTFDEVIVHCGTNYLNDPTADDNFITEELRSLIRGLQDLLTCQVTFSPILPRCTPDEQTPDRRRVPLSADSRLQLLRTNFLNLTLATTTQQLPCPDFNTLSYKHLLAKDGVHLSNQGRVAIENTVMDHITTRYGLFSHGGKKGE